MKKTFKILTLGLLLALAVPTLVNAQLFDEKDIVLSAGIGIGSNYYAVGGTSMVMPVLFVSGDYCLREDLGPGNLGVGAIMGFSSYKEDFLLSAYDYRVNTFLLGARGTYHFTDLVDKLDLYGGITLGGEIASVKYTDDALDAYDISANSGVLTELFGGARYYFSDNLAVMGELGFGISWLKFGISFKL